MGIPLCDFDMYDNAEKLDEFLVMSIRRCDEAFRGDLK
jgi:hypothetical protein